MALSQQTEQLFARVFGRSSETAEERGFLKDLEARKGIGTAASQGALEFAKQGGRFASPGQEAGSQAGQAPADPGSIDAMTSGMDTIKKKFREIDEKEKKLFREEQKFEIKKQLLSDPGFKKLLETRTDLREQLSTKNFEEDIPVTPGITNPLDVSRAAIGQQEGIGSFIQNASTLANEGEESVVNILDRLGDQRKLDYDNARNQLSDILTINQEARAERADIRAGETHELNKQQTQLQIQQIRETMDRGGLSASEMVNLYSDLGSEGWNESQISTLLNQALGVKGSMPLVENATGIGYVPGDQTFYNSSHKGVDIIAPAGSKVVANQNMKVEKVFVGPEGGLQVYGRDDGGNLHRYLHLGSTGINLSEIQQGVASGALRVEGAAVRPLQIGDTINAGQVFATIGQPKQYSPTELSTGAHLDYSIIDKNGNWVKPVEGAQRSTFNPEQRSALDKVFADVRANKAAIKSQEEQHAIDLKVREQNALATGKTDLAVENVQNTLNIWKDVSSKVNKFDNADQQLEHILNTAGVKSGYLPKFAEIALATGNPTGSQLFQLIDARIEAQGGLPEVVRKGGPEFKEMQALRLSLFNLVKAAGESGRLSDQDVQAAMSALPSYLDTKSNADAALKTVERLMGKASKTAEGTYQPSAVLDGLTPGDITLMQQAQQNYIK